MERSLQASEGYAGGPQRGSQHIHGRELEEPRHISCGFTISPRAKLSQKAAASRRHGDGETTLTAPSGCLSRLAE